ncbi:membrane fusion protein, Cu(I)/Ag(I) efflux system [Nitrosospira multiformis ATCC 25196]|uniref:Membrane fusion protein, Cu(I)/Ag(I) efflux system n=1 Tax=Nitrosospira multiformis (strain ATCC 25196 / NCIMB 11849 / C 71) TaxID=323848 RepID=Q2Y961_NITMU|nr:efflux RND transporter periplasmic adaptor subunit [Nitrosospira multiformis]ABB74710.1 Secretion protein HlyD [Nitrosospira multiformis ATCC 25196]SEF73740.1 membrane fusion protein, Cu(I)/Ag(I) efflux system [Nitrosospira multiformis ATCC 25196]
MKLGVKLTAFVALAAILFVAGYWWGAIRPSTSAAKASSVVSVGGKPERRILYYRNPMGLPDTSPIPKKDPMGMDYIPVYEDEESTSADAAVKIGVERIQKLGVRTERVGMRELSRTVRAVATVQADERRLYVVAPRFEGWIERLHVNTTGQMVRKGDPLMDVYSPDLITAQHEYLIARRGTKDVEDGGLEVRAGMERLAESALQRLRNWDISAADLKTLQQEGKFTHSVIFRSPASGVVLEKRAIQGQRFMAGEILYQIADLSRVWVLADVFEQDLATIQPGQAAAIRVEAYPDKVFPGEVTFIYPTVNPETRTAKVRMELPNPQELLKPAMYAKVEFGSIQRKDRVLAVPESAVLDAGTRQSVLVDLGEGRFEPRLVKLGKHADDYVEVLGGLKTGEMIVVKANFLIDAESNLKAALSSFTRSSQASMPGEEREGGRTASGSSGTVPSSPSPSSSSHRGEGIIEAIDVANTTLTLAHRPIASLAWPEMLMDFKVLDPALLRMLKPGQKVAFEITEASPGEYVIVRIQPQASAADHGKKP